MDRTSERDRGTGCCCNTVRALCWLRLHMLDFKHGQIYLVSLGAERLCAGFPGNCAEALRCARTRLWWMLLLLLLFKKLQGDKAAALSAGLRGKLFFVYCKSFFPSAKLKSAKAIFPNASFADQHGGIVGFHQIRDKQQVPPLISASHSPAAIVGPFYSSTTYHIN